VIIDGLTVSASGTDQTTGESHSIEVHVDGSCTHATLDDQKFDVCAGDTSSIPQVDKYLADSPAIKAFVDALGQALSDIEPIGIEMRQYNGAWYVSPTATETEAMLAVLRALDRKELDQLISLYGAAANEFFDKIFGGFGDVAYSDGSTYGSSSDGSGYDNSGYDDSSGDGSLAIPGTVPDSTADDSSYQVPDDGSGNLSGDSADAPDWQRCYDETDVAAATACFNTYVATGEIDATYIPIALRFPECGYADVSWSGELYSMSDADFVATVEAARPCFLALVAAGTIDQFELPTEVAHLECFEGRNWYNVFDDTEYDTRYYACLDAANAADTSGTSDTSGTA